MKKEYIISIVVLLLVLVGWWVYYTIANDDFTCYNYTTSEWSCKINTNDCGEWKDWKRTCNWVKVVKYTAKNSYICSKSWQKKSYSINSVCSQEFTDSTPPIVDWWIK